MDPIGHKIRALNDLHTALDNQLRKELLRVAPRSREGRPAQAREAGGQGSDRSPEPFARAGRGVTCFQVAPGEFWG
jgi:hypothetical protein